MSQLQDNANTVDIQTARLNAEQYLQNFQEMHTPLGETAALVEAEEQAAAESASESLQQSN